CNGYGPRQRRSQSPPVAQATKPLAPIERDDRDEEQRQKDKDRRITIQAESGENSPSDAHDDSWPLSRFRRRQPGHKQHRQRPYGKQRAKVGLAAPAASKKVPRI